MWDKVKRVGRGVSRTCRIIRYVATAAVPSPPQTILTHLKREITIGRKPREIQVTLVPSTIPMEEAIERWRQATEILMRVQERVDRHEAAFQRSALEGKTNGSRPELQIDTAALIRDFVQVAALAKMPISEEDITCEVLTAPHQRPKRLPQGKAAVYVFLTRWRCLKVGKVGSKSAARFTSQHYLPRSSQSNLAKSLIAYRNSLVTEEDFATASVFTDAVSWNEDTIGNWIAENATRIHFFIDESQPRAVVSLLEVFLQCRLGPMFEDRSPM